MQATKPLNLISLLTATYIEAAARGLIDTPQYTDHSRYERARARRWFKKFQAEPGDISPTDTAMLIGLAIAQAYIGTGPGHIPRVQALAVKLAEVVKWVESPPVAVIFRTYFPSAVNTLSAPEVIAIFPELPGTPNPNTCSSYMRTGQHGSCDPVGVVADSRAATPDEAASLWRELAAAPYRYKLRPVKRLHANHYAARLKALTPANPA